MAEGLCSFSGSVSVRSQNQGIVVYVEKLSSQQGEFKFWVRME